jgi:glycosyltransferase involved in cell wall biosynthesis
MATSPPLNESVPARPRAGNVLAIVPAFNEAASIERVIGDLRAHQPGCDIVVVDDHSTDDTVKRVRALGVGLLRLPINLGIGGAVQTGFRYARRFRYRYAFQFDGDGQHPADEVDKLLRPLRDDAADVVVGSRFLEGRGFQSTTIRRAGIRMFEWLNRITSGRRVTDTTSGFRAYNSRAIEFLADHYPQDYPEVEALTLLARAGFRITEVPVIMRERLEGVSSINLARSIYYLIKVSLASMISMRRPRRRIPEKKT